MQKPKLIAYVSFWNRGAIFLKWILGFFGDVTLVLFCLLVVSTSVLSTRISLVFTLESLDGFLGSGYFSFLCLVGNILELMIRSVRFL